MTITLYKKCCTWFVNLGNPELFVLPVFRLALAIANLAGMTTQLFPKPLHHADSRPEIC
jgi:hypothetical protein